MEEYIELIEKFLRGQMSEKEEAFFKASFINRRTLTFDGIYSGIHIENPYNLKSTCNCIATIYL